MLVKEYRILLPLSVEEYRIAQLYMIQRKSQEETKGAGSGVEIIVNKPYVDDDGTSGQYTFKIYHIGNHLPAWFRSILPDSAMKVVEEAWNAYPHTKTRFSCPFIEKFFIEVETKYFNDTGSQENVFNLSEQDSQQRVVDFMDIVNDPLPSSDYASDEDPTLYRSKSTGRGPLAPTWVNDCVVNDRAIMCAYKLCKVQFCYWGMQSRVERYIHDYALRRTMLRAHRQAWAWQDQWFGLKIEDIRRLELQAQMTLQKMMGENSAAEMLDSSAQSTSAGYYNEKQLMPNGSGAIDKVLSRDDEDESEVFYDAVDSTSIASFQAATSAPCRGISPSGKCNVKHLLLIFHGGNMLDTSGGNSSLNTKIQDVSTFNTTLNAVIVRHYQSLENAVCVKLVSCGNAFADQIELLQKISPSSSAIAKSQEVARKFWAFASSVVPVMSTLSTGYDQLLSKATAAANLVYRDFLNSEQGAAFSGTVSICGDAIGGLIAYDVLRKPLSYSKKSAWKEGQDAFSLQIENEDHRASNDQSPNKTIPIVQVESNIPENNGVMTVVDENVDEGLTFPVENLFLFGASLGLVLASRKACNGQQALTPCACANVFNLYYASDISSTRIEPLLLSDFSNVPAAMVQRYSLYPHGDGRSLHMLDWMSPGVADDQISLDSTCWTPNLSLSRQETPRSSFVFPACVLPGRKASTGTAVASDALSQWWGWRRIDYALYAPEDMLRLPFLSLSTFFYASFWESPDVAAFVLRQLISAETVPVDAAEMYQESDQQRNEKWLRRRTALKLKNIAANHRANDAIACVGSRQILIARFMYGPFDMIALGGELVEVLIMKQVLAREWTFCGSGLTDSNGRFRYELKECLPAGIYPVRMVVKGDGTFVDLCLAVVPVNTECVVFSIDGSFTASVSLTGRNPKVRPAAVDVVRFWQDLGYLIIYISARPDVQQRTVATWLAAHNFPFGLLFFNEGFSHDLLRQKTQTLKVLRNDCKIKIQAAYGSSKDVRIYGELGLLPEQVFAVGKVSKKLQSDCVPLLDGYSSHLSHLCSSDMASVARAATGLGIATLQLGRLSFGDYLSSIRGKVSVLRTRSFTPQCTGARPVVRSRLLTDDTSRRLSIK